MTIYICIDDNGGTAFNHRPQSRDRVLRQDLMEDLGGAPLYMTPSSARQFEPECPIHPVEDPLAAAGAGDACFIEGQDLAPWAEKIHRLVLYRWNRVYPADRHLDLDLTRGWTRLSAVEFPGSSHPTITKEVYVPCR